MQVQGSERLSLNEKCSWMANRDAKFSTSSSTWIKAHGKQFIPPIEVTENVYKRSGNVLIVRKATGGESEEVKSVVLRSCSASQRKADAVWVQKGLKYQPGVGNVQPKSSARPFQHPVTDRRNQCFASSSFLSHTFRLLESASSCSSPSLCFSSRSFCRMSSDALVWTKCR